MSYAALVLVCRVCEPHERFEDVGAYWKHLNEKGHVMVDLARWPDGQVAVLDHIGDVSVDG